MQDPESKSGQACPACGARLSGLPSCLELCHQLSFYTLAHPDSEFFIHQYAVDAYAAQHAAQNPKPMTTAFALIGLYLFAEQARTGRQVQLEHMRLAKRRKTWPVFPIPEQRAALNIADVLAAKPGEERDLVIRQWARSVWETWQAQEAAIADLISA
jgi:hypothetical protein